MEKTALQQLIDKWEREKGSYIPNAPIFQCFIDDAKAMLPNEKEQIVTTWNTAHQAGRFEGKGIAEENWQTFETYWEETFKNENE